MPKGAAVDETIGARITALRERRGWSGRFLASRAGISASTLSRIERGKRSANNRFLIADLAAALECSVTDLTGQPYAPADRQLEAAHGRVNALRSVLVDTALDEPLPDDVNPRPMPELELLCDEIAARWGTYDYATLGDLLLQVTPELHAYGYSGNRRAGELLLGVSRATTAMLTGLGYPGDAWLSAERGREVAGQLEDPVASVVAEVARALAATRCVGYRRAATLTDRAIDAIQPHLGQQGALSVLGMLHMVSTLGAMGQHRPEDAFAHIAEAEAIATRTGETTAWAMWFGPTNVAVWRVGLEVDAGSNGKGAEIARTTQVGRLPLSRQVTFHLDVARALAADRKGHDRAVRALLTAERLAPQHVRSSPSARETAHDLRESARRASVGSALRGLCERVGLPD